jgi:hypothetical protein
MGETVSKSEYARRCSVTPAAVSLWLARGRLTAPAILADGSIDVELADAQLRERLDHARRQAPDIGADDDADGEEGGEPRLSGVALIERQRVLRVAEQEARLRRLRREELEAGGALVRADAVTRSFGRLLAERDEELDRFVLDLAERLAGAEGRATAQRDLRALRERQADAAERAAAALPRLVAMEAAAP